jgi:uncharacterized iron-regulated membrane protein
MIGLVEKRMRPVLLKLHLWIGVSAAIFLVLLGVTGSIIAFEGDIDHWLHFSMWHVKTGAAPLPESALILAVEQRYAPAHVAAVHIFREWNLVQVLQMTDRATVMVNPYNGTVQGRRTGPSRTQRWLSYIHQLHTHLVPDPGSARAAARVGEVVVQVAGVLLCLLVPTGAILWWRTKRTAILWKASWPRICFDAHQSIGIWAGAFLFVAAVTGVLIGQERVFYALTHSPGPSRIRHAESSGAATAASIGIDRAMKIACETIPGATITDMLLPLNPKGIYIVALRLPEETSESVHSYVQIDQYSGQVLHKIDFQTDSPGYRAVRFNRSIHTGDILGTAGHVIVAVASLLLVAMVISGLVIRLRKLAV